MQATKSKDEKLDAFVKCHRRTEGVMWELCNKVMGAIITDAAIFAHGEHDDMIAIIDEVCAHNFELSYVSI